MSPEFIQLTVNVVFLAFAYLWAYPSLTEKTWRAIIIRDVAISVAVLVVSAGLFMGRGLTFSLILFDTNWVVFTIMTMIAMETPLFLWFAQKHGLSFDDRDAP